MKKSEAYHKAQVAVMYSDNIMSEERLEILRVLMDAEEMAKLCEEPINKEGEQNESV